MADKAKDKAAKPKEQKDEAPYALVSKFGSHGSQYTILRVSRQVGDKLKAGDTYDLKVGADGTITLKPKGKKAQSAATRRRAA